MTLRERFHKKIHPTLYGHPFFIINEMPDAKYYHGIEPRWARLLPCNMSGEALRGGEACAVALTWLSKSLRIDEDATPGRRQRELMKYLLGKVHRLDCHHRLEVRHPSRMPCGGLTSF